MRRWLAWMALFALGADVFLTLVMAPRAANFSAPLTQRIFYYHVPAAWVAYLAFGVTAVAGLVQLKRRDITSDAIALASAEIGTLFSLIALFTGLVWARQEFVGYDPLRDAKVVTLAVLILAYLAYFALRRAIEEPARRRRLAAVFGLLAALGVPLSYLASQASIHPDFTRADESLDPALARYLLFSLGAFTILYAALLDARARLALLEARQEEPWTT